MPARKREEGDTERKQEKKTGKEGIWLPAPARRVGSVKGGFVAMLVSSLMKVPDNNITRPSLCGRFPHFPTSNLSHKAQSRTERPVKKYLKKSTNIMIIIDRDQTEPQCRLKYFGPL